MDIAGHISQVNWLAVTVATISAFLLGGIWYSKALFGAKWMAEIGLTEATAAQNNMKLTFGATFVLQFLAATTLAVLIGNQSTWYIGFHSGAIIGVLWIATSYGVTYLFEQRSLRLFFINAGYYVVCYSVMGSILGVWPQSAPN